MHVLVIVIEAHFVIVPSVEGVSPHVQYPIFDCNAIGVADAITTTTDCDYDYDYDDEHEHEDPSEETFLLKWWNRWLLN